MMGHMEDRYNARDLAARVAPSEAETPDVLECLELAAAMGPTIDFGEWKAAGEQMGLSCDRRIVERLVTEGVAEIHEDRWNFVEAEYLEALARSSTKHGRWQRQRAACAQALYEHHPVQTPEIAARRATHLVEADKLEEALAPLLVAEQRYYDQGDYARAEAALDQYDQILGALGAGESDERRGRSMWRRGRLLYTQGALDEAVELCRRGEELLTESQLASERGQAALHAGRILRDAGSVEKAREKLAVAVKHFGAAGDNRGLALSRASLGMVHLTVGEPEAALEQLERAKSTFDDLREPHMVSSLLVFMAQANHYMGDRLEATTCIERAREVADKHDDVVNLAAAWNFQGEMARENQNWSYARRCYRRSKALYEELGSINRYVVRFNMALVDIGDQKHDDAIQRLDELPDILADVGFNARIPVVHAALAAAKAGRGDFDEVDEYLSSLEAWLDEGQRAHHDVVEQMERARRLLESADQGELAARAGRIAVAQRDALTS